MCTDVGYCCLNKAVIQDKFTACPLHDTDNGCPFTHVNYGSTWELNVLIKIGN